MKIRRNDLCPCDSGKKYKNCCIGKEINDHITENKGDTEYAYLKSADTVSLIKSFAGLTLLPQNHGKYLRLQQLSVLTFLHLHEGGNFPNPGELSGFLNEHFTTERLEDEPVCAFTEIVSFFTGDAIIFPGMDNDVATILSNLLTGIYNWDKNILPDRFKGNVYNVSKLLLAISDAIAKRLCYIRYMDGAAETESIYVPDDSELEKLRQAVTFNRTDFENLLNIHQIDPNVLYDLILDTDQINVDWMDPFINPFSNGPIYYRENEFIVIQPASLATTVIDFIWKEAEINNCITELATIYNDLTWNNTKKTLRLLQFVGIDNQEILGDDTSRHCLLSIDKDKIAYINYIGDERNDSAIMPEHWLEKWQQVYDRLQALAEYKDSQILVVTIAASNGRPFMVPMMKAPYAQTLTIPCFEFDLLVNLRNTNALGLWKYATALGQLKMPDTKLFSFLDGFKFYKDQNDSFQINEHYFPLLMPGYSSEWVVEGLQKADRHTILRQEQEAFHLIPVFKMEKYAPIYAYDVELYDHEFNLAVEIGYIPIWVSPVVPREMRDNSGVTNILWLFTDAITYWIWQMSPDIRALLPEMGKEAIKIGFQFDDVSKFVAIQPNYTRLPHLDAAFTVSQTDDGFLITIPDQILPYLYGADNEGERVLVKNILKGFNLILGNLDKDIISLETIVDIVNRIAPLGNKKKVFIRDTNYNPLLTPNNVGEPRFIQLHDVSHINSQIRISSLPDLKYKGSVHKKADMLKISGSIVQKLLLPLLKQKLARYDCDTLLKRIIGLNESFIIAKEEIYYNIPTRIACYASVDGHESDIAKQINENTRANLAIRCLIEHIAAERYLGTNVVSDTAIDELVAIMDRIVNWGGIGDQIQFDLVDTKIEILDNGIINIINEEALSAFSQYHHQKTRKEIIDSINEFQEAFSKDETGEQLPIPAGLDNAFLLDVGVTFTRICDFLDRLVYIALQQTTDYAQCPLQDLQKQANAVSIDTEPFGDNEFKAALDFLSLRERGDITNLPSGGYEPTDICPWKYNRMLSLVRKPLVITGRPGQEIVYWGPRQCMQSKLTIGTQIFTGRFRTLPAQSNITAILGTFANERGANLMDDIVKALQAGRPKTARIFTEQFIKPNGIFRHSVDIGDIDVLVIDPEEKVVYSLECKSIAPSRRIKEMVEEVGKVSKEWIPRHVIRHEWLTANIQQVSTVHNIDLTDYRVKSLIVTSVNLLTPHLKKIGLPLPLLTLYEVELTGYAILKSSK